jgi:hypothetical protein
MQPRLIHQDMPRRYACAHAPHINAHAASALCCCCTSSAFPNAFLTAHHIDQVLSHATSCVMLQELAVDPGYNPGRQGYQQGGYEADELRSVFQRFGSSSGFLRSQCSVILQQACSIHMVKVCSNATCRGTFNNPSGWYEPGATTNSSQAAGSTKHPVVDEWNGMADSAPAGRFGGSSSQAAGAASMAADDTEAAEAALDEDGSSAVQFLEEEPDGALFMNQDATWSDAVDAPAPVDSLQAQLPDWGAISGGSGNGSENGSGGPGATDSPAQQSHGLGTGSDGIQGSGAGADEPAETTLEQQAGPTSEELAQQLQVAAKAEPYDFGDPMALLNEDMEDADLQARSSQQPAVSESHGVKQRRQSPRSPFCCAAHGPHSSCSPSGEPACIVASRATAVCQFHSTVSMRSLPNL